MALRVHPMYSCLMTSVFVRYIGAIDDNSGDEDAVEEKYVENAIEALRAGKTVAVKNTKAIGCSIKWKKS